MKPPFFFRLEEPARIFKNPRLVHFQTNKQLATNTILKLFSFFCYLQQILCCLLSFRNYRKQLFGALFKAIGPAFKVGSVLIEIVLKIMSLTQKGGTRFSD